MASLPDIVIEASQRSKAGRNEVRKLAASFLNSLGAGVILAGFAVPYIASLFEKLGTVENPAAISKADDRLHMAVFVGICAFAVGAGLHVRALFIAARVED